MDKTKSRINIMIPQEIHRATRIYGITNGETMAKIVAAALERFLAEEAKAA